MHEELDLITYIIEVCNRCKCRSLYVTKFPGVVDIVSRYFGGSGMGFEYKSSVQTVSNLRICGCVCLSIPSQFLESNSRF